jgi:hypothetical protein
VDNILALHDKKGGGGGGLVKLGAPGLKEFYTMELWQ